jgi:hypothetical protein
MSNVQTNSIVFVARASINIGVVAGVLALLTGNTVLYSLSFTAIIVGFVAGSVYLLQKK